MSRLQAVSPFLAVVLIFVLTAQTCAQEEMATLPVAAQESRREQEEKQTVPSSAPEPQDRPAKFQVAPKLVGKKVRVYCRGGRIYKGRLVEATSTLVRIKTQQRMEQIALTEIAAIEKQKTSPALVVAIVGVAIGTLALGVLIVATRD